MLYKTNIVKNTRKEYYKNVLNYEKNY